jgi:two-component system sensor histidine kinase PilS (NtrC family)
MAGSPGADAAFAQATRRRLKWLMAARLGLSLGVFALTLLFIGYGREGAETAERGLYGTLAACFGATLVYASLFPLVRQLRRFGFLQLATDVAVVTSLVCWSGGANSFFGFLYLPITLFGAMLFDRRGAYGSAVLSSAGYALALVAAERWGIREVFGGFAPGAALSALWVVHTAALLLVALLSSALAGDLRATGEALEESATDLDRLRRLHERTVESLTSGLLTSDPDGRVTSFNPEAERITGRQEAEVLGLEMDEVLPGVRDLVMKGRGQARLRLRTRYKSPDGRERHVGLAGSILRDAAGQASGYVMIFQDVTAVVAMEQDLRRSERLAVAGQLAAGMAHEIRNPLAAISGSIEMLQGGLSESAADAERHRLMDIVLREVERLDRLIADFLVYARPAPAHPTPVALQPVIQEVLGMFATSPAGEGSSPTPASCASCSGTWCSTRPRRCPKAVSSRSWPVRASGSLKGCSPRTETKLLTGGRKRSPRRWRSPFPIRVWESRRTSSSGSSIRSSPRSAAARASVSRPFTAWRRATADPCARRAASGRAPASTSGFLRRR